MSSVKDDINTAPGSRPDKVQGEGDHEAGKRYNEAAEKFVKSGNVEQAARAAEPDDQREADEMEEAGRIGRKPAKEEDPAVGRPQAGRSGTRSE